MSLVPQPGLNNVIRFGAFELDPEGGILRKHSVRVRLQDQPFRVLLMLLENQGEAVTRDQLQRRVWPDSEFGDFEHSLNIAVNKIRQALGDSADAPRFIETLPRRGYRFIARVERTVEVPPQPEAAPEAPRPNRNWLRIAGTAFLLCLITFAVIWWRPSAPPPGFELRRLTNDSSTKLSRVVSDGSKLYLQVGTDFDSHLAQLSLSGGEPVNLSVALPPGRFVNLLDITPDGEELLLTASDEAHADSAPLWTLRIADGTTHRVGNLQAADARFSPDGRQIAFTTGYQTPPCVLWLASSDGSNIRRLLELKDEIIANLYWWPDGQRLAFGRFHAGGRPEGGTAWEVALSGSGVRRLFPDWQDYHVPAGWTPDGRLVLASAGRLWVADQRWYIPKPPSRFPVSSGEPRFRSLTRPGAPRTSYAVGTTALGELHRWDMQRGGWAPHLGGMPAQSVEYSRDGARVAYVTYPEQELWVRSADGTRPVQLTKLPLHAMVPRWSPDGTRIAFTGTSGTETSRIYIVDAAGGTPHPACRNGCGAQADLTWAPDGKRILYDDRERRCLRMIELDTGRDAVFEGSEQLYSPRWSPDGSMIAAMDWKVPSRRFKLYRVSERKWKETADPGGYVSWPSWSNDSQSIWYLDAPHGMIRRYGVRDGRYEDVVPAKSGELTGTAQHWFGLTPKGEPMVLRRRDIQQVYALDWKPR